MSDTNIIILSSEDCSTCKFLRGQVENLNTDIDVEFVNLKDEAGADRLEELMVEGLHLKGSFTPQCYQRKDGRYFYISKEEALRLLRRRSASMIPQKRLKNDEQF